MVLMEDRETYAQQRADNHLKVLTELGLINRSWAIEISTKSFWMNPERGPLTLEETLKEFQKPKMSVEAAFKFITDRLDEPGLVEAYEIVRNWRARHYDDRGEYVEVDGEVESEEEMRANSFRRVYETYQTYKFGQNYAGYGFLKEIFGKIMSKEIKDRSEVLELLVASGRFIDKDSKNV